MALTVADAIERWARSLGAANRSPKTIRTYLDAAKALAEHVGPDRLLVTVSRDDHETLLEALAERGWKPASRSVVYRALRSFWAFVIGHPDLPPMLHPMAGMSAPAVPETSIVFVSDDELHRLLETCGPVRVRSFRNRRDEAILRLFATTGARLSEIAELRLADVQVHLDDPSITVVGKGRRTRALPLDGPTTNALAWYLEVWRPDHFAAGHTDRLWIGRAGPMTAGGIAQMVARRGREAGIDRRVHPHELRHRFVATALGAGLAEGDVMALSGHRSRSMLDRYGRVTRAQRAHVAFRKAVASGALPEL